MSRSSYACVRHIFCWLNVLLWVSIMQFISLSLIKIYSKRTSIITAIIRSHKNFSSQPRTLSMCSSSYLVFIFRLYFHVTIVLDSHSCYNTVCKYHLRKFYPKAFVDCKYFLSTHNYESIFILACI